MELLSKRARVHDGAQLHIPHLHFRVSPGETIRSQMRAPVDGKVRETMRRRFASVEVAEGTERAGVPETEKVLVRVPGGSVIDYRAPHDYGTGNPYHMGEWNR